MKILHVYASCKRVCLFDFAVAGLIPASDRYFFNFKA